MSAGSSGPTTGPSMESTTGPDGGSATGPIVDLEHIAVVREGRKILGPLSWRVEPGQHWIVLGPNGGGKSTLLRVASLALHPTEGRVRVLGHELGRVDVRSLRARLGVSSSGLVDQLRGSLTAAEIVQCGLHAALEPWWHTYSDDDVARAGELLTRVGLDGYDQRTFSTLSSGERQRALLARTLMADPDVLLLDEPTAGLDLAGREALVGALDSVADDAGPATVFVTHHVEDIPSTTTHLLAIGAGRAVAAGPIEEVLSSAMLSTLFELDVDLQHRDGRWFARSTGSTGFRPGRSGQGSTGA